MSKGNFSGKSGSVFLAAALVAGAAFGSATVARADTLSPSMKDGGGQFRVNQTFGIHYGEVTPLPASDCVSTDSFWPSLLGYTLWHSFCEKKPGQATPSESNERGPAANEAAKPAEAPASGAVSQEPGVAATPAASSANH